MALQLLHGDIEQLRREYMVLFTRGVSITRKLGFSDIIMPGRASASWSRAAAQPRGKNLRRSGVSVRRLSRRACRGRPNLLMLLVI